MLQRKTSHTLTISLGVLIVFLISGCSNQKNTSVSRFYHSLNTRYNIHYNADIAYTEALEQVKKKRIEDFSEPLFIYPDYSDTTIAHPGKGAFTTTIDKTTKAIKLHSIKTRPRKNPARRDDQRYQAWLQQKEFNPFLDKVWLLLGKAELEDGNYLRAISTFMYTSKIYSTNPDIVAECQLRTAMAYSQMGWMYEAGNVLHKIDLAGGVPPSQAYLYAAVKSNYLIRTQEYEAAIPHLEFAIQKEKDKVEKIRMKYLLGQIYEQMGEREKAHRAFAAVSGLSVGYVYAFNAQLRKVEMSASSAKAIEELNKIAKKSLNKEYLDQVYYAVGNVYMNDLDTVKAIASYEKAVKNSTRNGIDKAKVQIALGDIYFQQRDFVKAQPHYAGALAQLKKANTAYPRVAFRSAILDELAVHVRVVQEQDSLQALARLPEPERMRVINDKIAELKKEEEKQKKEEEQQVRQEERTTRVRDWGDLENQSLFEQKNIPQANPNQLVFGQQDAAGAFYFYNEQSVAQGKIAFQKTWGNRRLEDDWRRRNRTVSGFADMDNQADADALLAEKQQNQAQDSTHVSTDEAKTVSDDKFSPEYYLQQLPFTEDAIKESNVLIDNALFDMGKIYRSKLEDMPLAIQTFTTNINRFPETPNLEQIYYQLFLIYMQMGNDELMTLYRNKLISEFADGVYAVPLSEPDYEWNFRHMADLQDSLYEATYTAYLASDIHTVRANYQAMKTKYPFTDLMPNFTLLNALTFAQTRDAKGLQDNLKDLVKKYPKSDVIPLAEDILGRMKDGQILLSDGSPIKGIDWSNAFKSDDPDAVDESKPIEYAKDLEAAHILLLRFKPRTIDRNDLLFKVADYNFSNYVVQTFDLSYEEDASVQTLQIKGFDSFSTIKSYMNKAFEEGNLMSELDTTILAVPISVDNYARIFPRLGLEKYVQFFTDSLGKQLPQVVAYWNKTKIELDEEETVEAPVIEKTKPVVEKEKPQQQERPAETRPATEGRPRPIEPKKEEPQPKKNDKEVTADDLLTKDQLQKLGQVNDIVESAEEILSNPVDGIKNLFKKYKNRDYLTKEEKAELKAEEKLEKQRLKELQAIEKAKQDSISKAEKAKQLSIDKAAKSAQDSINAIERQKQDQLRIDRKEKEDAAKATVKAREDARKEREDARKEKERLQKERLRERDKIRKEKEKEREKLRKEKEREAEERRKAKTKK